MKGGIYKSRPKTELDVFYGAQFGDLSTVKKKRRSQKRNSDLSLDFGGELYAGIGGGVKISINISELGRRVIEGL